MPDDQGLNDQKPRPYTERVDAERKHLEGLLKDRINFHLLFASVFMVGVSAITNHGMKVSALATITLVSFLIGLAVFRTHLLVREALKELREDGNHPYAIYNKRVWFAVNANTILVAVPFVLTAFFLVTTVYYGFFASAHSVDTGKQLSLCTSYQVDDNSDRRIINGEEKPPAPQDKAGVNASSPSSRPKHNAR